MKAEQVDRALAQKFVDDDVRLVFWHDAKAEFEDYIAAGLSGPLADVQILRPAEVGGLSAKLQLERESPSTRFLIYTTGDRPTVEQDWLLDLRLYSAEFHADVVSLWLKELELSNLHLRDHLERRSTFLASQDRRRRLSRFLDPDADETAIDRGMLAVLTGADDKKPFAILRSLFHGHLDGEQFDFSAEPEVLETIAKMDLTDSLWSMVESEFGYREETRRCGRLLSGLFLSELSTDLGVPSLEGLGHLLLPERNRRNAKVFLAQWRDSSSQSASYDAAAHAIQREYGVADLVADFELDQLGGCSTFFCIDQAVLPALRSQVVEHASSINVDDVRDVTRARREGHWLSGPGRDAPERVALRRAYDAVEAAAMLFALRAEANLEAAFGSPMEFLQAYQAEFHEFDRLYRHFWTNARYAERQGWDLLKDLSDAVEALYSEAVLEPMGRKWSALVDDGFLETWRVEGLTPQQDFYRHHIRPHLAESDRRRAFVIISDAFRFEAASELVETINGRARMTATLDAMLGVLPSYTTLGMASLLPHSELSYTEKGDVLADGNSTASTDARNKHLASVEGMACKAGDLSRMKTEDAREFTKGARVVYIYHNVIDARGDSASTESETFDAVATCIQELEELVSFCIKRLNAAKVWVTADHGFLFQQSNPDELDRVELGEKPAGVVKTKKRYVIGKYLHKHPSAHLGSTKVTAGAEGGMEFWIPRSISRFHFTGGARFVHGGAMPQEVVVPVVVATQLRGSKAEKSLVEKVGVSLLANNPKITTPSYRFQFIQTEAVSERRKPVTARLAVYEGDTPVTSVHTVTFDSTSDSMDDRRRDVKVDLKTGTFDKRTPYRLILRDVDTEAEILSQPVTIDRSFDDDF